MPLEIAEKHALAGKRIIVAGAGLAGMTFVRALYRKWPHDIPEPRIVVYERSSRAQDRSRNGYTMGIRRESGLSALHSIGLLDRAVMSSTTTSDGFREQLPTIWMRDWRSPFRIPRPTTKSEKNSETEMPGNIRLVRHTLRDILLDGIPNNVEVCFDKGCERTLQQDDGRIRVELSDGSTDVCDLLVAADGANSKVRESFLPDQHLEFAGAICFCGTSKFPNGKPELLQNQWGIVVSGQGVPFLTFPIDGTSGAWALSYRSDTPVQRVRGDEAVQRRGELLDEIRRRGKMFEEPFNQFISATDPPTLSVFNAMHKYPVDHTTALPDSNVVFIGDANHPMSPFSGNGANMALADGVELAEQLIKNSGSIRTAIQAFDKESMPRSKASIDRSWWVIRILHSSGIRFLLLRVFVGILSLFKRKQS